jgi:hypothetical protein
MSRTVDVELPELKAVPDITIPVGPGAYRALKETYRVDPTALGALWGMRLDGWPVRGFWTVVGLREDYVLNSERTYWVTLRWSDPRG